MPQYSSEDVWDSYKELKSVVWKYMTQERESNLPAADFENTLKKHKNSFVGLLQNPPKNEKKREELKSGAVDAQNLRGLSQQALTKDMVEEAIILSDMFNLNEMVALDLLVSAQIQKPNYPGLTRGLVAVLLYYDGQRALVSSLLCLVQARRGIQWTVNITPELAKYVTDYTDDLVENGLFTRILELLKQLDLTQELEMLQCNLALGGPQHRRQITDIFNDIKIILADIVFSWSIQCGLPREYTLILISLLREAKLESEASGLIDNITLYLLMALLSAIDLSVLHSREDGEEVVQSLPIMEDSAFITAVVNELLPTNPKWVCEGLQALTTLGMAVCLAVLRVIPQSYIYQDAINKEDVLVDMAIEMNVFKFLHNIVLDNKTIYKERYLTKRMHHLITDFIIYMYPKVKDLRMKANEVSRTLQAYASEGLDPPSNLPRYFEYLLLCIGKFYSNRRLNAELSAIWWSPIEIYPSQDPNIWVSPRTVALYKFIKLAGDMLPTSLFVPFIKMLTGLSSSDKGAKDCFTLLRQPGNNFVQDVSWDHFFMSLTQYYSNLREEAPPITDTVYAIRHSYNKRISPQELDGIKAMLCLIRVICIHYNFARLALCEHPNWSALHLLLGLVSCSIPLQLKAEVLETLAVLCEAKANATRMWENLESSQIIVTVPSTSNFAPRGILTELDEIESRLEEYPLTRGLLKLLDALTGFPIPKSLGAGKRTPGFNPYFNFVVNEVFLKYNSRAYQNQWEKWEIAALCLKLFEKILKNYQPKVTMTVTQNVNKPTVVKSAGYHLMIQLNNNTEFFKTIMYIIDEGNHYFDSYVSFPGQKKIAEATLLCLMIIYRSFLLYPQFLNALGTYAVGVVLTGTAKLLLGINTRTQQPDLCLNIAKYVCYQEYIPKHTLVAVKILMYLTEKPTNQRHFYNILLCNEEVRNSVASGFFQCMDRSIKDVQIGLNTKKEIIRLLIQCLHYYHPNLSQLLLGFDLNRCPSQTVFQYPGVLGQPRNCLNSLLALFDSDVSYTGGLPIELMELAHRLLYELASHPQCGDPVLRFVRMNKSFFPTQLNHCKRKMYKDAEHLRQISWLMKALAIELNMACVAKQMSYLKYLASFLGSITTGDQGSDEKFLHQVLCFEVEQMRSVPDMSHQPQSPIVDPVAKKRYEAKMKKYKDACDAVAGFVDAWRQIAGVLVTYIPLDILDIKEQQIFSITLLLSMLKKVVDCDLRPRMAKYLSGASLLMINNIKWNFEKDRTDNVLPYYLPAMKDILKHLIRWILKADLRDSEVKANLFTTLVMFLEVANADSEAEELQEEMLDTPRSGMSSESDDLFKDVKSSSDIMMDFGNKLEEILCDDITGGPHLTRILSMCCYMKLSSVIGESKLVQFIYGRGYLRYIIQSITDSNRELRGLLEPGLKDVKICFLYKSRMMLLIQLAETKEGAQALLEEGVFAILSNMSVFTLHPEITRGFKDEVDDEEENKDELFLPPDMQYLELFLPTLELCNAILTTLGTENQSATVQIMHFLFCLMDVVQLILRSADPDMSTMSLKEAALLTCVISRTANNNLVNVLENPNIVVSRRGQLYRIQRLMLGLIPKFLLTEENVRNLLMRATVDKLSFQTSDRLLYAMQIASNLLWYARNSIANNDVEHGEIGILFYPSYHDPSLHVFHNKSLGLASEQEPSLGLVILQLIHTVNHHHQEKVTMDLLSRKMNEIPDMSSAALKLFIKEEMETCDLSIKRQKAKELISNFFEKKKQEMDYCAFIIENCLYLIWTHLDYFMLRIVPDPRSSTYLPPTSLSYTGVRDESVTPVYADIVGKVTAEVIYQLKQGMVSILNDTFCKRLIETAQGRSEIDQGFVEVLLRKIKRLIQFAPNF